MKQTVNFNAFCDSFTGSYANTFSYDAKRALFDCLEEYEAETGTEIELNPIAFACDYTEYKDLAELNAENTSTVEDHYTLETLGDYTTAIQLPNGGLLIENF